MTAESAANGRRRSAAQPRAERDRPSQSQSQRPLTVVVAMLANLAIAAAKFVAAAFSGSAAMFAEGVHSLVDTLNQGLLLYGVNRSLKLADRNHPFGYGKEVYFWALIYSVLLFGIGGGVSVYKGINALVSPSAPEALFWNYVVLGVAFAAECTSWVVAIRAVHREAKGHGLLHKLKRTTDPTRFIVIGEDSAAMLGIVVAFFGILLSQQMNVAYPDAVASILIGLILCGAALALTKKTKDLLVGQAAAPEVVQETRDLLQGKDGVLHVGPPLTMQLGPKEMLAAVDVKFSRRLTSVEVAHAVDEMEASMRSRFPQFTRIYIEAQLADRDIEREQPPSTHTESEGANPARQSPS